MAISNLVTPSQYYQKPSVAGMFGQSRMANDNLSKQSSSILNESFVVSVSNSIVKLNDQLSKLQENSKSLIKSIDVVVGSIRKLDRDMTQRFRKLNAEIKASQPDFSKFAFRAPPLPLMDMGQSNIPTGTLADPSSWKFPTIVPPIIPPVGGGGKGGTGGGQERPKPKPGGAKQPSGTTGVTEEPKAKPSPAPEKPPAGTPETAPKTGVVSGEPERAPVFDEKAQRFRDLKTGRFKSFDTIEQLAARNNALSNAVKKTGGVLGRFGGVIGGLAEAIMAVPAAKAEYEKYQETGDKQHLKNAYEIAGGAGGSLVGAFAGGEAGALVGSVLPGVGTAAGAVIGGLVGSMGGSTLGRVAARAAYNVNHEGMTFEEAYGLELLKVIKEEKQSALDDIIKKQSERLGSVQEQNYIGRQNLINQQSRELADISQRVAERERAIRDQQGEAAGFMGTSGEILQRSINAAPPPTGSPNQPETKEEGGERGSPSASAETSSQAAAEDARKMRQQSVAPSAAPAPTTPAAPPPPPRPQRMSDASATPIISRTTNVSSSSQSGENRNVTNPNMQMTAQNEFLRETLARQVINETA